MMNQEQKKNFFLRVEQQEQRAHVKSDASMMVDVVRKKGKYPEPDADMEDIIDFLNNKDHYHTIADSLEASAVTQEELDDMEECLDEINILSLKKEKTGLHKDELEPEEADTFSLEDICELTCEDEQNAFEPVQTGGIASLFKGMAMQEPSCQPYILCQKVLQEKDLCFLDLQSKGPNLCLYNGKFWQELDNEELRQLVFNVLPQTSKMGIKAIESLAGNVAAYIRREVRKSYDEGRKHFTEDDFRKISNRIVFNNTVYDLERGKKCKFSSKRPYSYQINCDYVEADLPTPYYDKLKYDATGGDKESMKMIDYMIAYLLLPNRTGKCFFVMSPARDSGKNVLGEFVERLFYRKEVRTMDTEFLGSGKFAREGFDTARLATCLEMPVKPLTTAAVKELKTFTGNSSMDVQGKYAKRIDSLVNFKVLLATNGGIYLPAGEFDEAFYRRVIAIPFVKSTPMNKLVFDLPQRLDEERDAIVSKCVRKFKKVFSEDGGVVFPESPLSQAQKATWMGKCLFNEEFAVSMFEFTANEGEAIPKSDVETLYGCYYKENASNSFGMAKPTYCSKENLIKVIKSVYPGIESKKLRRDSVFGEKYKNPIPCLTCLRLTEEASEIVAQYRQDIGECFEDEA